MSYCDGCGERYNDENLMDAENGRSYCYRCYGERRREVVKPRPSPTPQDEHGVTQYHFLLPHINRHLSQVFGAPTLVLSIKEYGWGNSVKITLSREALRGLGDLAIGRNVNPWISLMSFSLQHFSPCELTEENAEPAAQAIAEFIEKYILLIKKLA